MNQGLIAIVQYPHMHIECEHSDDTHPRSSYGAFEREFEKRSPSELREYTLSAKSKIATD